MDAALAKSLSREGPIVFYDGECGLCDRSVQALIRLDNPAPLPSGLLALGQRAGLGFETRHGSELRLFLGNVLSRSIGRWLLP